MKYLLYYIIIGCTFFFCPLDGRAGTDPIRAGLFVNYAKQAKQALKAQDAVMSMNLAGHIYLKEQVEATTNFQRQFNDYLTSFGDILSLAADIYGIYYEVDQAVKNIKELKSIASSSPANLLAVAFSEKKNNIYVDVIDHGIQFAADIRQLLPIRKDRSKNTKMTEFERFKTIGNVRRSLRSMNYKIKRMNRIIRYTTLMDSWYELRGNPQSTRSMKDIVSDCHRTWMRKAKIIKY